MSARGSAFPSARVWGAILLIVILADVGRATPPAFLDVWVHPERLLDAASVFGDRERRWFANELSAVSDGNQGNRGPAPFVEVRPSHGLLRAMIGLICPSLQQGDLRKINAFFATLDRRNAIRGRGNYAGWTRVSYRLHRREGQLWELEERHQPVSGPEDRAVPLRDRKGTSFIMSVDPVDPDCGGHRAG